MANTQEEEIFVCRCQEVTEEEIRQAIADGCRDLKGVKNRTEAMMGLCQGRTCRRQIERMLADAGAPLPQPSYRPPVRALPLEALAGAGREILDEVSGESAGGKEEKQ